MSNVNKGRSPSKNGKKWELFPNLLSERTSGVSPVIFLASTLLPFQRPTLPSLHYCYPIPPPSPYPPFPFTIDAHPILKHYQCIRVEGRMKNVKWKNV